MNKEYYQKLHELAVLTAEDFEFEEYSEPIGSNFPWLYIRFVPKNSISLWELKEIEKIFNQFTAVNGGQLEAITAFKNWETNKLNIEVKMVYVDS